MEPETFCQFLEGLGMTQREFAHFFGVSERTAQREWAKARALLYTFLGGKDLSV